MGPPLKVNSNTVSKSCRAVCMSRGRSLRCYMMTVWQTEKLLPESCYSITFSSLGNQVLCFFFFLGQSFISATRLFTGWMQSSFWGEACSQMGSWESLSSSLQGVKMAVKGKMPLAGCLDIFPWPRARLHLRGLWHSKHSAKSRAPGFVLWITWLKVQPCVSYDMMLQSVIAVPWRSNEAESPFA